MLNYQDKWTVYGDGLEASSFTCDVACCAMNYVLLPQQGCPLTLLTASLISLISERRAAGAQTCSGSLETHLRDDRQRGPERRSLLTCSSSPIAQEVCSCFRCEFRKYQHSDGDGLTRNDWLNIVKRLRLKQEQQRVL